MSKIKISLLALVATFAVSAFAAASAFAGEPELFLVNGAAIPAGEDVPITTVNGTATLQGGGLKITCTTVTTNGGDILAEGKSALTTEFTNCTVEEPAHCIVAEPIVVKATDQALLFEGKPADTFSPEVGNTFVTLNLSSSGGTCSLAGTVPVTGTAQALIDNSASNPLTSAEEEKEEHELTFNASSGSALEVAGSTATFKLKSKVKLGGTHAGQKFSVHME